MGLNRWGDFRTGSDELHGSETIPPGRVPAPQDRLPSYLLSLEIRLPTFQSGRATERAPTNLQVPSVYERQIADFVDELDMGGSEKALGEE